MKTTSNADYTIKDELGWTIPEKFIAVVDIEDDESSACTNYEQIQTEDFVTVVVQMHFGIVLAEYVNQDWHIRVCELMKDLITADREWALPEIEESVREWVDEINSSVEHYAQEGFEARQSGDYWEGEY